MILQIYISVVLKDERNVTLSGKLALFSSVWHEVCLVNRAFLTYEKSERLFSGELLVQDIGGKKAAVLIIRLKYAETLRKYGERKTTKCVRKCVHCSIEHETEERLKSAFSNEKKMYAEKLLIRATFDAI